MEKQQPSKAALLSIIPGLGQIYNKQKAKGFIFLGVTIVFVLYFLALAAPELSNLITLGDKPGRDNSLFMLIRGAFHLIFVVVYVLFYFANIKDAHTTAKHINNGIPVALTFKEMVKGIYENGFPYLLIIPSYVAMTFAIIFPVIVTLMIAFTNYDHNHLPPKNLFTWVGLANLGNVITGDMASTFFPVLGWTLIWAVFATATCFFFGIILALLINTKGLKYKAFWRTIFVITMAVPPFVSLLIMRNLLNGSGPINALLLNWGLIDSSIPFLTDPNWAKLTIIVVNMWIGIPATMLISTGIIQNLPEDQIEAARIDGANKWQIFKSITFPQILFVMTPALIQQFIGNINNFNVIYLLTGGGPANSNFYGAGSTDLLVTWLYKLTVDTMDYNLASVIGILIFILSAVFSLIAYTRTNSFKEA